MPNSKSKSDILANVQAIIAARIEYYKEFLIFINGCSIYDMIANYERMIKPNISLNIAHFPHARSILIDKRVHIYLAEVLLMELDHLADKIAKLRRNNVNEAKEFDFIALEIYATFLDIQAPSNATLNDLEQKLKKQNIAQNEILAFRAGLVPDLTILEDVLHLMRPQMTEHCPMILAIAKDLKTNLDLFLTKLENNSEPCFRCDELLQQAKILSNERSISDTDGLKLKIIARYLLRIKELELKLAESLESSKVIEFLHAAEEYCLTTDQLPGEIKFLEDFVKKYTSPWTSASVTVQANSQETAEQREKRLNEASVQGRLLAGQQGAKPAVVHALPMAMDAKKDVSEQETDQTVLNPENYKTLQSVFRGVAKPISFKQIRSLIDDLNDGAGKGVKHSCGSVFRLEVNGFVFFLNGSSTDTVADSISCTSSLKNLRTILQLAKVTPDTCKSGQGAAPDIDRLSGEFARKLAV